MNRSKEVGTIIQTVDIENELPILGIIMGDSSGIGAEIVAKLASEKFYQKYCRPILIGDVRVFQEGLRIINEDVSYYAITDMSEVNWNRGIPILDQKNQDPLEIEVGKPTAYCGQAVIEAMSVVVDLYKKGQIDGFCWAPLNKAAIKMTGSKYEGAIPMLVDLFESKEPAGEINVCGDLWTTRVTSHIPISQVTGRLTITSILDTIHLCDSMLKRAGKKQPRLGVAALNPHAGENGLCGSEELEIIEPAMNEAKKQGIDVSGPYSSDILFVKAFSGDFDGVVTMYHDQGQIAMKLKNFDEGIAIAGGLPAPAVTCAHGTAYDVVGKGIAGTDAFKNAIKMASKMAAS